MAGLRSPIRYFGGKGLLRSKLSKLVPEGGRPYCEPYCGGASLFFYRDPAPVEVLNDLNGDVVNLFRCIQDEKKFFELRHRIVWTLYARQEFIKALEIRDSGQGSDVDRAWAFFVCQNQGFGGTAERESNWGKTFTPRGGSAGTASRWMMRQYMLDAVRVRLMPVQIDSVDAIKCIKYWDSADTVFYIDPPYVQSTRKNGEYAVEADDEHHKQLVATLLECKGSVTLSGYAHPIYDDLERAGWSRIDIQTSCHAAGRGRGSGLQGAGAATAKVARTESVWLNARASDLLMQTKN